MILHDRRIPKSRANIDHLVVAASGVWVVDAKTYSGLVERRDKGGLFKTDDRLYVGGRDQTKLVGGLTRQVDAVYGALDGLTPGELPIHAALCFVDAEWRLFAKPFRIGGVWVTGGKRLAEMIAEAGPISATAVMEVAERLSERLVPA